VAVGEPPAHGRELGWLETGFCQHEQQQSCVQCIGRGQ
jgi:hypothetical protein